MRAGFRSRVIFRILKKWDVDEETIARWKMRAQESVNNSAASPCRCNKVRRLHRAKPAMPELRLILVYFKLSYPAPSHSAIASSANLRVRSNAGIDLPSRADCPAHICM